MCRWPPPPSVGWAAAVASGCCGIRRLGRCVACRRQGARPRCWHVTVCRAAQGGKSPAFEAEAHVAGGGGDGRVTPERGRSAPTCRRVPLPLARRAAGVVSGCRGFGRRLRRVACRRKGLFPRRLRFTACRGARRDVRVPVLALAADVAGGGGVGRSDTEREWSTPTRSHARAACGTGGWDRCRVPRVPHRGSRVACRRRGTRPRRWRVTACGCARHYGRPLAVVARAHVAGGGGGRHDWVQFLCHACRRCSVAVPVLYCYIPL